MLVVGFPTHGLVGSIAAGFLVEALNMVRVARVESDGLPPTVVMLDGLVDSPIRIYSSGIVCGPDKKCSQLLVAISDIQPEAPLLNPLARAILDWAEVKGVAMIFAIEGKPIVGARAEEEPCVVAMANLAGQPVLKSSGFEAATGMITGFAAALLKVGIGRKIPVVCLVPETREDQPDGRAAARVIEAIRPLVPELSIDPAPLIEKAERMEADMRKSIRTHRQDVERLTASTPEEMYR